VKSGGAKRDSSQFAKDDAMATEGGALVGKNVPKHLRGTKAKIPTEVRRVTKEEVEKAKKGGYIFTNGSQRNDDNRRNLD
jgi:hypothetical protein